MSGAVLMFASRRTRPQPSADAWGAFAALFLRFLDLDARLTAAEDTGDLTAWQAVAAELGALRASALRLEPVTADDMRRRVVICCNAPLPSDRGTDAALIREARYALGLPPNA
jgi:hypothetical protein